MIPYFAALVLLANGIVGSVLLNEQSIRIQSKHPAETDLNAIRPPNPNGISRLSISHTAILNTNYTPLKKFSKLLLFNLTDVTGAPRITKDFFRNVPELSIFILSAKESYNEVEFEEDALQYANKLQYFIVERLYTVPRLSSRFLGPNLKNLKNLGLDNSAVSLVEANAFDYANNLNYLSIVGNGWIKIEKGAFRKLTKLEDLYLHGNHIQNFSWDYFGLMPSVMFLSLSDVRPEEINVDKIRKYFPSLVNLMLYTDNCKQYKNISPWTKGFMIQFLKPNEDPCFRNQY